MIKKGIIGTAVVLSCMLIFGACSTAQNSSAGSSEANTPYYLYMSVGSKNPWNIDCTLYYRDVLNKMGVKNQTDLVEGYEHDSNFWQQCFYNYLNKIFRSSPSKTAEQAATAVTAQTATAESKSADLTVKIGDTAVEVEWQDNEAVNALKELVKTSPLEIKMSMYGGFEQVGNLGKTLPNSDEKITTEAGDIVLYSGNQISVFYGSNTWDYTRLGRLRINPKPSLKTFSERATQRLQSPPINA